MSSKIKYNSTWHHEVPVFRAPEEHRKILASRDKVVELASSASLKQQNRVAKRARKSMKRKAALLNLPPKPPTGDVAWQKPPKGVFSPNPNSKKSFYASWEWRKLRMQTLVRHGHRCQSCGATTQDITIYGAPVRLVVDHIQPLGKHWELRLDPENVQVLCDECNMGKGDWMTQDFR